jgi:hypothetical protein
MASNKNIKYINKSFDEFRGSLIDYSRTYFPTTYNDFSAASPGMMFMEMAAYVGDVLSFYLDNQVQENYLQFARQSNNLFELAYMFGYKPKVTGVAVTSVDFYQKIPSILSGSTYLPDFTYALYINENATVSNGTTTFLMSDTVDFSTSSSTDLTEISVYEVSGGNPTYYLLKKTRKAISSTITSQTFNFGSPVRFSTVELTATNLIGILDCTDSDGNKWYEVDHLGQEMVYDSIRNTNVNDPNLSQYSSDAPHLLKLKKVQRRFTTRLRNSSLLEIQFGAGTTSDSDEEIIPNPDNIGIGLPFEQTKLSTAYSPTNFLFTKTYGIAPSNTILTFRYLTGGGVTANANANSLTTLNATTKFLNIGLNSVTANDIFASLTVTNPNAASGGGDGDSIEEIRQNSSANFATQLRNVTQDDYLVRALSMPSKYGSIAKSYIEPTKVQNLSAGESNSILDLYILTYDINRKLTTSSQALKQNLITYLSQHRMVNDAVNIKDGFVINIGVSFDIIILPNYNSNDILTKCVSALQTHFNTDKWQMNQPIILRDIYILLDRIEGVQTVKTCTITNKTGVNLGYSQWAYDVEGATRNNVVYPSIDPMIFEVKYPATDIQGRVVSL